LSNIASEGNGGRHNSVDQTYPMRLVAIDTTPR